MQDSYSNTDIIEALLFRLIKNEFGLNDKETLFSTVNQKALRKMYSEIYFLRKKVDKSRRTISQKDLVDSLLRELSFFKGKKRQKKLLRILKTGKVVSFEKLKRKLLIKVSRGQSDKQWRNSISALVGKLEKTLSEHTNKDLDIKIEMVGKYPQNGYRLTIKDKEKFPWVIVR